ncbi:unnamed protein product, partial [Rotaria sp. Silwood1]
MRKFYSESFSPFIDFERKADDFVVLAIYIQLSILSNTDHFPCEFDIKNINLLTNIIKDNRADLRLIEFALEILTNVITYDVTNNQEQSGLTQDTIIQF